METTQIILGILAGFSWALIGALAGIFMETVEGSIPPRWFHAAAVGALLSPVVFIMAFFVACELVLEMVKEKRKEGIR